ncbi:unnamed protein product [Meloidogyne enterolobii]|uniref:Uncharacterized protein n=1 Tax=Meloidogyne enterolobii TaxID=390850 RepID=A0ACB0YEC7_MELEN
MKNKIKFFVLLFTLLFSSFSSSNLQNNQRILVKSTESNKNEDGSVKINLLRMEVNEIEEGTGFYKIEILYEIDEKYEKDYIYISSYPNWCFIEDVTTHKIKNINNGNKGKKLILIEDVFWSLDIVNFNICLNVYDEINEIYDEINDQNDKEVGIKIIFMLNTITLDFFL